MDYGKGFHAEALLTRIMADTGCWKGVGWMCEVSVEQEWVRGWMGVVLKAAFFSPCGCMCLNVCINVCLCVCVHIDMNIYVGNPIGYPEGDVP